LLKTSKKCLNLLKKAIWLILWDGSVNKYKLSISPYLNYDRNIFYDKYHPGIREKELGLDAYEIGACVGIVY
jgi:hypothetical protein